MCVTSLWWMDWLNYSRMLKECCVFVFSIQGLRIYSLNAENLGLETANTNTHTHTDISCLIIWRRPAVTHVETRCALHTFLKTFFFFSLVVIQSLFFFLPFGRAAVALLVRNISDDWFMSRPHLSKLMVAREGLLRDLLSLVSLSS